MRTDEITRPQTRAGADQILRNAGYRRLGSGSFAAIYRKPGKPYVLRVFSASDKAYRDFMALARAHEDNPHFPRFYGKVVTISPSLCAIRMEPLTEYKWNPKTIYNYVRLRDYTGDPRSLGMIKDDALEFMFEFPKLREACDLIIDELLPHHEVDIKQDNLMMRGGTIVLVDPVKSPTADPLDKLPYVEPEADPGDQDTITPDDLDLLRQLGSP